MNLLSYIKLMRPRQWVKNFLIFAPAFFAGTLFVSNVLAVSIVAFILFSLAASAVYIANDLADIEQDKKHSKKKNRLLASGAVSKETGMLLVAILLIGTFALSYVYLPTLLPVLFVYVVLNSVYSVWLKHVAFIDITLVASFYVLRVLAGGVASETTLSPWIILATFFLALFLISGKRKGEFAQTERRKALDGYSKQAVDGLLVGSAVLSIVAYGLWAGLVHPSPFAVYTVIPVTAVLFRVLNQIDLDPEKGETPEVLVFTDIWVFGLTALWALSMGVLFYL